MRRMRWIVAAALLALVPTAHAESRLRLSSDRPVVIVVNMVPHTVGENGTASVTIRDGKEGNQRVMVRNLLGQEVWSGMVEVPRNTEVRARWKGRSLEVISTRPYGGGPGKAKPQPRPGSQDLHHLAQQGSPSDEVVALDDVDALIRQADATGGGGAVAEPPPGLPPPPEGQPSRIKLVNRTPSWANVYVDGQLHEFRGQTEPVELQLTSGAHRVEVKDFRDKEDWGTGTLWVYPDVVLELHFSKHEAPAARNLPEAWRPDP